MAEISNQALYVNSARKPQSEVRVIAEEQGESRPALTSRRCKAHSPEEKEGQMVSEYADGDRRTRDMDAVLDNENARDMWTLQPRTDGAKS